ncbi:MAG TPA: HAD family hydrolase [Paracoccaceae bacterium]|nr:HAD family hydrolase [Paracoccaceae bacterium]
MPPALIGLDADDTLWHNESVFRMTEARFAALLGDHAAPEAVSARLLETERRNLALYGYGVKGFTLSMIETAHEIAEGDCPPEITRAILAFGREMLAHPVEPFEGVAGTLEILARRAPLVLVTKGDLFDQERKLAQSGLGELFSAVEIVSEKTPETYARLFARHGEGPERAVMVGDSLRSDVLPALDAGAWAVHVPYEIVWAHEAADPPEAHPRFRRLDALSGLPALLDELETP